MSGHRPEALPHPRLAEPVVAGLLAVGPVALALVERLLTADDAALHQIRGVASPRVIALLATAEALPWVDGVVYLERSDDPRVLLPTTRRLDVPATGLLSALLRQTPDLPTPVAIDVDARMVVPVAGAQPLARSILRAWPESYR